MTIQNLVEAIVLSRSHLTIVDTHDSQLAQVYSGDEQEYANYANYEVMEIWSVQPFCIIARIWV